MGSHGLVFDYKNDTLYPESRVVRLLQENRLGEAVQFEMSISHPNKNIK